MPSTGRFFPVSGLSLGIATSFATVNVQYLGGAGDGNSNSGPFAGSLGQVVEDSGKCYRLVQFDNGSGNVASVAGGAAHWKTRASFIVTMDQTDAEASLNSVAGGFLGVVTDLYYCFIQMGGVQAVVVDTTATAGKGLIGTTTDGTLVATTTNTKGDQLIYAVSYGTNTTTSANAYWNLGFLL